MSAFAFLGITRVSVHSHKAVGNRLTQNDNGTITNYAYNSFGQRLSVTDANNHTTGYGYNSAGYVITTTDALNDLAQYGYDAIGNRTVITDARSNVTTFIYDASNRLRSTTIPLTGTQTALTRYGYDAVGNRTVITDANSHLTRYGYDALNRTTVITDASSNTTRYGYDAVSNRTVITDALGNATRYTYDNLNRVITITNPTGKTQGSTYDAVSNRLTSTDELTQTTRYAYDAVNRVISTTNPLTQTTRYAYDKVGNTTTITSPTGLVTPLTYWETNWLKTKTTPIGTTQYAYDSAGNLTLLTQPSLAARNFGYDKANRMVQEQDRDAGSNLIVTLSDQFDANSNRLSETESRPGNSDRVTAYTYDKANRLITTNVPNAGLTTYAYDAVGNQTGVTDPGGYTTSVTPNAVNLPITTTLRAPNQSVLATTTGTYDARNILQNVTTVDTPNSLTLTNTLTYNSNSYLVTDNIGHQGNPYSAALTSTVNYQDSNLVKTILQQGQPNRDEFYDGAGRVICSESGAIAYMVYDGSGHRLVRYWNEYGNPPCSQIIANPDGNALYKRATYSYDGNRLIAVDARGCQWGVCNPNTFYTRTLTYDAEGNLTQVIHIDYAGGGITHTLSYGWETDTHHMTSVTHSVSGSGSYTATLDYDRQNRIRQFCTGAGGCSTFAYVGSSDWLASIIDQYGNVTQRYFYANGRPLRIDYPSTFGVPQAYYRYNWHGDVAGAVGKNGDGAVTWTTYGAWGDLYDAYPQQAYNWNGGRGYMKFPNQFNINLNDALDIGLYYVHGRWYNQDTGLFLSPDEKGEYFYGSGQNPVDWVWAQIQGVLAQLQALKSQVFYQACGNTINPSPLCRMQPVTSASDLAKEANRWLLSRPTLGPPLDPAERQAIERAISAAEKLRAVGGLTSNYSWGRPETLEDHFTWHKADFGAETPEEYARMASDFLIRSQAEGLPTRVDDEGIIGVYEPATNTLGLYNPDGTTKTYFKPTSPTYWERRIKGSEPFLFGEGE